jgi:hypothetical protein
MKKTADSGLQHGANLNCRRGEQRGMRRAKAADLDVPFRPALLAQPEALDERLVLICVRALEIIEELAAAAHHA